MEEIVQALFDEGALVRNGDGEARQVADAIQDPADGAGDPGRAHRPAAAGRERPAADARGDRQGISVRAGAASASRQVGRRAGADASRTCSSAEFIYEQPAIGDIEYTFKHALTQEVAYNSVLIERRRHAARATARRSNRSSRRALDDHLAELAHHYAPQRQSGEGGGILPARGSCNSPTSAPMPKRSHSLRSGLEQLQKLPDDDRRAELELDLRIEVSGPMGDSKGYSSHDVEQSQARALELCQRSGINRQKTWAALFGIFFVQQLRPDVRRAEAIGAELVVRAEEHGRAEYIAEASNWLAYAKMVSGDFEHAAEGLDRAWALLESNAQTATGLTPQRAGQMTEGQAFEWRVGTRQNNRILSGWNLWFLGYPDRALERMNIATAIAHSGPKTMMADIHGFATYIYELRREPEQMRARAAARLVLATESGYFTGRVLSEIYLGWADALAGDLDGGIARMRLHMSEMKAAGSEYISDRYFAFIATALGRLSRFDEALGIVDESFGFIERTGQQYYAAELHRLKGELLLAQDSSNVQAEQSFCAAIEIARKQHAKSWELRATTSLARMLAKQGKRDKARSMLAEIYNWFTEGFDTADLKDAKALMEELRG